ncbi:TPA: hypothetical protein ACH3X2_001192 [Trebouxia sp. C0005]
MQRGYKDAGIQGALQQEEFEDSSGESTDNNWNPTDAPKASFMVELQSSLCFYAAPWGLCMPIMFKAVMQRGYKDAGIQGALQQEEFEVGCVATVHAVVDCCTTA